MYRVTNGMSHLKFLKYLSTHLTALKRRRLQQLKNTSAVYVASGNKITNDTPFTVFDSMMPHQRRAEALDVRATQVSKNTLATKFPLRLDREYHPFVT